MSVDADTTLQAWAGEKNYPGWFATDSGVTVGKMYGSVRGNFHARNVFVIGPDGKISYRIVPFNVLSADQYSELEKAVDSAAGVSSPP